jgi:hypothetical protein
MNLICLTCIQTGYRNMCIHCIHGIRFEWNIMVLYEVNAIQSYLLRRWGTAMSLQVVKIRLQQQRGLAKEQLKYKGPIHCAATTLREEGIRGMWAGAAPTVGRNGTNQMCLFWAKANVDSLYWGKHEGDGKQLTPVQVGCAAS